MCVLLSTHHFAFHFQIVATTSSFSEDSTLSYLIPPFVTHKGPISGFLDAQGAISAPFSALFILALDLIRFSCWHTLCIGMRTTLRRITPSISWERPAHGIFSWNGISPACYATRLDVCDKSCHTLFQSRSRGRVLTLSLPTEHVRMRLLLLPCFWSSRSWSKRFQTCVYFRSFR